MFITFEGPDGSGKTTQIKKLAEKLRAEGYDLVLTREPGGTEISDQVRDILMNLKNQRMFPRTEILLFCSARAQLVEEVIRPALAAGKIVICDRYVDSTLAYQGYGHQMDLDVLRTLLNFTTGNLWPDMTLLLDIPSEEGLQRRIKNHEEWNRMDDYQVEFHKRVRAGYLQLMQQQPARWRLLDARMDIESLQQQIWNTVQGFLLRD